MAETSVVTFPGSPRLPELKLAKLDLDRLLASQSATLAAAQQVQTVLVEAAQAIARLQHGYLTEAAVEAKAALAVRQPAAVLTGCKDAAAKGAAVSRQIVDVTLAGQRQAAELVAQCARATVAELKAVAA